MIRLLLVFVFALAQAASAQTEAADMRDLLRSIHLDPAFRENLRERGYTGERFEVMIDHTRRLYADDGIITGLQRKIDAGLRQTNNRPSPAFFRSLDQALEQANFSGLTRLSAAERQRVFATDFGFINAIPVRECNRLVAGRLPPERAEKLFDTYLVQLTPQRIADYHALLRKATRLGLARGAVPRALSAADRRRAEEAIFPLIDDMIGKQKNAKTLYRAWSRGPSGVSKHACTFNRMFGAAALSLRGKSGELAVLYLMSD